MKRNQSSTTTELTFRNARGDGFKLPEEIVRQLQDYIQHEANVSEAGGVLLGRYIVASDDVVVDQITTPAKGDKRTRLLFIRSKQGHQGLTHQAWSATKGTRHYLGEWHTHPESDPTPSKVDLLNWNRLLAYYRFDPDPLYFVIVGIEAIAVWQGHKTNLGIEKLALV